MHPGTGAHTQPALVSIALQAQPPYDAAGVFEFLAARAIAGVEYVHPSGISPAGQAPTAYRYARTLQARGGPAAFEVRLDRAREAPRHWQCSARIETTDQRDIPEITALITSLLDLSADAPSIDAHLAADPALAPLVREHPGVRVPGAVDPAELVIRAIVGQQISVTAARGHLGCLTQQAGRPYQSSFEGLTTLFPTPAQILDAVPHIGPHDDLEPDRPLRLPRRQSNAVRTAAEALAHNELSSVSDQLSLLPGIGPWTAAYVALRAQGDPDAWLLGDVALVAGARAIRILPRTRTVSKQAEQRALAARAEQWAPWRSYASMHLWRAAARPARCEEPHHAIR